MKLISNQSTMHKRGKRIVVSEAHVQAQQIRLTDLGLISIKAMPDYSQDVKGSCSTGLPLITPVPPSMFCIPFIGKQCQNPPQNTPCHDYPTQRLISVKTLPCSQYVEQMQPDFIRKIQSSTDSVSSSAHTSQCFDVSFLSFRSETVSKSTPALLVCLMPS